MLVSRALFPRLVPLLAPVLIVGAAASALVPAKARACGGLFCSQTSPTPVDQSAEKILFEVREDGSVTATVEIKYNGDPRDFSWIVPVTGAPDFVEVAEKDELLLLDQATRPTIIPPTTFCSNPPSSCGDFLPLPGGAAPVDSAGSFEGEGEEGVNVTQYPSVGPFEGIVVVDGVDPGVLMTWLQDNDYQVTEEMRPFIEQYTLEGYSFLATRLRADAEVRDMVPIRFHCPQPNPEIPLRLTAIAAEPDMGFLVFVAGPERYELANYQNIELGLTELQTDPNSGITNYFALISKKIDEAGGRGFLVERADTVQNWQGFLSNTFLGTETEQAARDSVTDMLGRQRFITRFYARMSAEEMTEDPVFVPAGNSTVFTSFNLSSRTYDACPADGSAPAFRPTAPTCGTLYCGEGDGCALSNNDGEGCVCRGDHLARTTTSAAGGVQVVCTSPAIDVHGGGGNPCAGHDCGDGVCLPLNDRPTCRCDEGAVGVLRNSLVTCTAISGEVFESGQILWPALVPIDEPPSGGCKSSSGDRAGGAVSFALLFASAALVRRLLRRR